MVFIVHSLILRFASSAYHHAHMIDTYDHLCYGYFCCQAALLRNRQVRGENEWLHIRAVSFVFVYLDLMCNHSFSNLTLAISQQYNNVTSRKHTYIISTPLNPTFV